jgi:hypothetical protein
MHVVDSKIGIYCSLKSSLRLNVGKIDESGARALHEKLFRATITMQGETRVPIAIGRGGQSECVWDCD